MKNKHQKGFTLVELIIYIAIVSVFVGAAVLFTWDVIYGQIRSNTQREVSQNIRLGSKRIVYEIRNASGINSVSSDELCLANSDSTYNPTKIYVNSDRLRIGWGGGSSNCTSLTNDQPLTSNKVTVSSLSFTDVSSGTDSYNVSFSITVESTGERSEWDHSQSYSSSAELRSN